MIATAPVTNDDDGESNPSYAISITTAPTFVFSGIAPLSTEGLNDL